LLSSAIVLGLETLRPYTFQIVPVATWVLLIPLVTFFSTIAGFYVWKSASISWSYPLYLQYGDGSSPYAQTVITDLVARQRYDVSLSLVVPANDANIALGNFMTSLTLATTSNHTIAAARRPGNVMPPRKSWLFSTSVTRILTIPLMESFIPGTSAVSAFVEVGRHDRWAPLNGGLEKEITVQEASLHGVVHQHGIRGLISRFPSAAGIVAGLIFFITCTTVIGTCVIPVLLT
ncbi:hypothetical protein FISHEDRAFT_11426, partial [Fistulina hepatica ATCC 64428]